jgi:hypothetical protein
MTELSERTHHLDAMSTALWKARCGFTEKGGLDGDKETYLALVTSVAQELHNLAMVCTGHDYLDSYAESMADDAALCFRLASEEAEERRSSHGRMLNRADALYDARV